MIALSKHIERREYVSEEDHKLIFRHVNGDKRAFPELMERYRKPVYSYLVRSGLSTQIRDELFSDIFFKIHRASRSYQPKQPLRNWIFTIVANTVKSHYRKEKIDLIKRSDALEEGVHRDTGPSPVEISVAKETSEWLQLEIEKLPIAQRETLLLCSLSGFGLKEAAKILGVPANTAKTNLRRAKERLAQKMTSRKDRATSEEEK